MRHQRLPFALLALSALLLTVPGCDSADNPIAPSGSVLTITANPTQIALNGAATLTVTGFKPDGNPLNPGTQITLSTTLGVLAQTVAEVASGRATTTLSGDGRSGTATVTATLPGGGETSATVDVLIGQTVETQPTLSITASPNAIGLNESAQVTAVARNADGSLFGAGGQVNLRTDLGWLVGQAGASCGGSSGPNSVVVTTASNSEATATLCAGNQPGTATITGSVGASAEVTATVTFEQQRPVLILSANPSTVGVGGTSLITILARDEQGFPLGADERIRLTAELGTLSDQEAFTDANGEASVTFTAGSRPGDGRVIAILGNSEPTTVQIRINDAPASFSFTADRGFVNASAEAEITLTVDVQNSLGSPLSGVSVTFGTEPNIGGSFDSGTFVQTTGPNGRVVDTFRIPQGELTAGNDFDLTAIVRGEGVELPQQRITIEVRP